MRGGFWHTLLRDTRGQDLVEYAILTALAALAAIVSWQVLAATVGGAYASTDGSVQSLAEPPNPF